MKRFTPGPSGKVAACVAAVAMMFTAAACGGTEASQEPASQAAAESKPQELKFAYFLGEKSTFGQLWTYWMDEVTKRTNGTVTFERFWDASLLKGPEMLDGLRDGRVDVAQVTPPMYPGKFPLTSVTEVPFVSSNVPAGASAITKISGESQEMQAEWKKQGVKPLAWNIAAPGALGTKEPLDSAEDLKGRKIRGIDRSSKVLGEMGANLVNLDVNEVYGSMDRGLINGFFGIPFAFVGALKFPEVAKHYTDVGMGITTANALSMSEQGWARLSKEQQDVMLEVSKEIPAKLAEVDKVAEDATCEAIQEAGAKLSAFGPEDVSKLRTAGEAKIRGEWMDEVSKAGADGTAFYETWKSEAAAAESQFPDYEIGLKRCMATMGAAQ